MFGVLIVQGGISGMIVFGFNINTPSVLTGQIPALKAATTSEMVRTNLNTLHTARKSFIEAESSEKIQRALRSNVRTYEDEEFLTRDTIIEDKSARDAMALLKYWVRKVSVY